MLQQQRQQQQQQQKQLLSFALRAEAVLRASAYYWNAIQTE